MYKNEIPAEYLARQASREAPRMRRGEKREDQRFPRVGGWILAGEMVPPGNIFVNNFIELRDAA